MLRDPTCLRQPLEKVLASPAFCRNARLCRFRIREKAILATNESIGPLREAVALDSTFAPAYAALADAAARRSNQFKFNIAEELVTRREAAAKADAATIGDPLQARFPRQRPFS
ncbi:MAG TPA: hypothetical protein VGL72_17335 [Bryobacteraceae bacterium]